MYYLFISANELLWLDLFAKACAADLIGRWQQWRQLC